jgi:fatty-acyl-CoA synthase
LSLPTETGLIGDWLAHHARLRPAHTAVIDLATGRRFTYGQWFPRVARLAGAFRERGVQAGDRVMVLARNSTDVYETLFACWRLGAVFMPVNWRLAPSEIADILADATPALVVVDEEFLPLLSAEAHAPAVSRPDSADGTVGAGVFAAVSGADSTHLLRRPGDSASAYERAIAEATPVLEFATVGLDTVNTLLYTSGTTGQPKGVIGNWRMTTVMLLQASISGGLGADCVTLTAAPQFHTAGLNSFATALIHLGGTLAVMAVWEPGEALRLLADPALGVTHTLGVPTQFLLMTRHPTFGSLQFPTVRMAAVGGAPPTTTLMDTCAAHGLPLTPGYGMTECFGVTQISAAVARRKPGAVGWPALYTELRVADENGRALPAGEVGEIQIRSAGVTPGYWNQPEATAAAFMGGWYRTGDLGYFDDEGLMYVVDRKKDMFISGGENVYPVEVENVISSFPEVLQVACIGVPHETWGEVGAAYLTLRPGFTAEAVAGFAARCREQLAAFKVPKSFHVVEQLPMSAQGKVLKTELRKQHV